MKTVQLQSDGSFLEIDIPVNPVISSPAWSANLTLNTSGYDVIRLTLAGDTTLNLNAGADSQKIMLEITQDSGGNHTLSFGSNIAFGTDITSITLSTTGSKTDYIGLIYNTTASKWRVIAYARGY